MGVQTVLQGGEIVVEFLAVGECDNAEEVDKLVSLIEERMFDIIKRGEFEFVLTASIGYTLIVPDEPVDIKKSVRKADEYMYAMKKRHHESR